MGENVIAFMIWVLFGLFFVGMGVYNIFSKRSSAAGFWANAEVFPVKDVRSYNRAMGKLWIAYGIIFALLGLPFLFGDRSSYLLFPVLGVMLEAIIMMIIYVLFIEKKYRRK